MFFASSRPRFLNYQVVGKNLTLSVAFFQGEIWLTQKQLADIFSVTIATVNEHLKKIFADPNFPPQDFIREFRIPAPDGKSYLTKFYHSEILDEIQRRSSH